MFYIFSYFSEIVPHFSEKFLFINYTFPFLYNIFHIPNMFDITLVKTQRVQEKLT